MSLLQNLPAWLRRLRPATKSRRAGNAWLQTHCAEISGRILSIGSGDDSDRCGGHYRDYFPLASSYTTSEVSAGFGCDLVLDIRSMPQIAGAYYDCIFCSGVLEHVDSLGAAVAEITRILKPGGILLLGLPFRQGLHLAPHDYWRFTEFGIRALLAGKFEILNITPIDCRIKSFPAAYWCKARKI